MVFGNRVVFKKRVEKWIQDLVEKFNNQSCYITNLSRKTVTNLFFNQPCENFFFIFFYKLFPVFFFSTIDT